MSDRTRERHKAFAAMAGLPDDAIDLAQASLLIAREEYPDLQIGDYLARLDGMAAGIRARLRGGEGCATLLAHINRLLFDEMGFRGNREEYFDPRNSFLNDVIDRRVGIPITLSAIYLEVGRRIGCPLAGVSFPGHFLVRYTGADAPDPVLIDPFHRGRILTETEVRSLLDERYQGAVPFRPELLKRARNREILERMLYNLKAIFQGERDFHRALWIQHLLLCLRPDDPREIRDRAVVHYHLACFEQAADDLERWTRLSPAAPDLEEVRGRVSQIRRLAPRWN